MALDHFAKRERVWLWGIVLATFAASLVYSFSFRIEPAVDARAYDNIALEFLETGKYPENAIGRPGPGYEFFLTGVYSIFGHSYPAVWIIQALLLAASVLLVFFATKEIMGEYWHPLAGLAAALIGFSPDLITVSAMLMTETLLIFLISLSAFLFFKYLNRQKIGFLVAAGLVIALGALVRGNIAVLFLAPAIFLLIKKQYWQTVIFIAVFLAALIPWTVHNYKVYGVFKPFNASAGILYVGNHPGATGELILNYPLPEGYGDFSKMEQLEFDDTLGKAGKNYILSHPFQFLKLSFWRMSIYFSAARPFAFWPHLTGFAKLAAIIASSLYALVIFGLGFVGAVLALSKKSQLLSVIRQKLWLLFGMFLAMPVSVAALIVETRYRFPAYIFLAIFAGFAIYQLTANRRLIWERVKAPALVLILLVGNTVFDVIRNFFRILERL